MGLGAGVLAISGVGFGAVSSFGAAGEELEEEPLESVL